MNTAHKINTGDINAVKIKETSDASLFFVGAYDPSLRVFDIIMHTEFGTSYNSYLIKTSAGNVLIETAKVKYYDSFLARIKSVIGDEPLSHIIVNHTEPDHSGSAARLLTEHSPNAIVVGTSHAIDYLEQITNMASFKRHVVEPDDAATRALTVGGVDFTFHVAPFLHWPDTMFTHVPQLETVFTCDFLGSHYSPDEDTTLTTPGEDSKDYWGAFKYYYDCIFGPFPRFVQQGLDILKDLKFDTVGCSHGPVLIGTPAIAARTALYKAWAVPPVRQHRVLVGYVSAYGYTTEMAELIADGIRTADPTLTVDVRDLVTSPVADFITDMSTSEGIVLGSPTINGEALPQMWAIAAALNPIAHQGLVAAAFGSYGWSGQAPTNIHGRLQQITSIKTPLSPLMIRFKPSDADQALCRDFGGLLARSVNGEKVTDITATGDEEPEETPHATFIADGQLHRWKCVVCGEVVVSEIPPELCEACGAGADAFILLPDEDEEMSTFNGKVVIVGGGPGGFNAARVASERSSASVTLLCGETHLPYYRMSLSHEIGSACGIEADKLTIKPQSWYDEAGIETRLGVTVTSIDRVARTVETPAGPIPYDRLILATGGSPFIPYPKVSGCPNSLAVRTIEDVDKISRRVCHTAPVRVAVIGAGVLGLECLPFLLARPNVSITVIERGPHIMGMQLDRHMAGRLQGFLAGETKDRLTFMTGAEVTDFTIVDGQVAAVQIKDHPALDVDLVIWAIGVRANTRLAVDAGIKTSRGVLVDEHMVTCDPNVLAVGDCAEPERGPFAPNWAGAVEGGVVAGLTAIGLPRAFPPKPFPFMLSVFGKTVLAAGTAGVGAAETFMLNQESDVEATKLFTTDGVVTGASKIGTEAACADLSNAFLAEMSTKEARKWIFK